MGCEKNLFLSHRDSDYSHTCARYAHLTWQSHVRHTLTFASHLLVALYNHYDSEMVEACSESKMEYSLLNLLHGAKAQIFSDSRDRLFAFVELAQDFGAQELVRPDYTVDYLQIYERFARAYICTTRNMELLEFVFHNETTLDSQIPSWVPHWNIAGPQLERQRAFGSPSLSSRDCSESEPVLINDRILKARGVLVGSISWASAMLKTQATTLDTVCEIWKEINRSTVESPYSASSTLHAFLDTMVQNAWIGDWPKWSQQRAAVARQVTRKTGSIDPEILNQLDEEHEESDGRFFLDNIKKFTNSRRFVVTSRGYFGLAPHIARVGDECAIIFGCVLPCVLQRSDPDSTYQFLGLMTLTGSQPWVGRGGCMFFRSLGCEDSKDWVDWDVEDQVILLC